MAIKKIFLIFGGFYYQDFNIKKFFIYFFATSKKFRALPVSRHSNKTP